jgi:hypothetical protein
MFHHGQACGPVAERRPRGLDITSRFGVDPETGDGWRITTGAVVNQRIPAAEVRFLVHWGARLYMDFEEMKVSLDHSDDLTHDQAIGMLIDDLRARGIDFEIPTDPMNDRRFIGLVSQVYDIGGPINIPPDAVEELAA